MCYSGVCPYEIYGGPDVGDCGKRPNQVCPQSFESDEEWEEARQKAQDDADNYADHLYEVSKDRRFRL